MEHCDKWERIATLEANQKNFMATVERIETKLDNFIEKCDETYATKSELDWVREELALWNARKVARIQQRWPIVATIVSGAIALIVAFK